ncbi:DUF5691 domain-containing protein [Isosphaeraceae bacterium EP7]
MTSNWDEATVLALAPDPASAKAGQGLASARKWASLGAGDGLIWGECHGSGANPYQTKVDLDGPAFSCSCPSRKFPCKHGLGLSLIWASEPASFTRGAPPAWVISWKENREKKAEQAKSKSERGPAPADLAARAKRDAARNAKVAAGLDDLSLWIADLVRQGFASLGAKSGNLWEDRARRMIDAQAPGVARRLRQVDAMSMAGEGWQANLLDHLSRIHLLVEGFRRLAELPTEVAEDVRAAIGYTADLDVIRAGFGVRDRWQVIGRAVSIEDQLTILRTWMIGRDTGRPALVLDFSAGGRPLDLSLPPGVLIDAELAFFPGSAPLRALVKERHATPTPFEALSAGATIASAFAAYGVALAQNPWLELYPIILDDVVLQEVDGTWSARDISGAVVPLSKRFQGGWDLLALEGGGPLTICGEFDGTTLDPLGARAGGRFLPLVTPETSPSPSSASSTPVPLPLMDEATASALLGIDRRPPPLPSADDPIGRALPGLDAKDLPSRLLSIAVASSLYGRVGRKPAIDPSSPPDVCPTDDQPACQPAAAARLRRMLGGDHPECLPDWIERLAASGRRLNDDAIVGVLSWCENHEVAPKSLREILGVRGGWLAAKRPRWRKHARSDEAADPTITWETGALHERMAVLRGLRASDPGRARELVASTFTADAADRRAAFVGEFARGLSMEDEPFLEAALDDRSKEVRRQAAEHLRSLPESRLCLRMIDRARVALDWKRAMLGLGRGTLVVAPPTSCDKATIRDGVEPKPPAYLKLGERGWWLHEIVSSVPTKAIAAILEHGPAQVVEANRGGEWEVVLRTAWATSAIRQRDAEWAEALLEAGPGKPSDLGGHSQDQGLLAVLPPDRRDAFLLRRLRAEPGPLRPSHPAFGLVGSLNGPVGVPVAREILGRVRPIVGEQRVRFADPARMATLQKWSGREYDPQYHDHPTIALIHALAEVLPFELADEAAGGVGDEEGPRGAYAAAYATMIDRLRFRRDMHREFDS